MSQLGGFNASVQSGGAQLVPSAADLQKQIIEVGVCTVGTPAQLYTPSGSPGMRQSLGAGPLVESGALIFNASGPQRPTPPMMLPVEPGDFAAPSAITGSSGALATITASCAPHLLVEGQVKSGGGTLGNMQIRTRVGGGAWTDWVTSQAGGSWIYRVPGVFTRITFPSGTYTGSETFSVGIDGTVTSSGGAATHATLTSGAGPYDLRGVGTPHLRIAFQTGGDQDFSIAHAPATKAGSGYSATASGSFNAVVRGWPVTQAITITSAGSAVIEAEQINEQAKGFKAVVNGGQIDLVSDDEGTGAIVTISSATSGAGNIGITDGTANGTGDCVDLGAVTALEMATKLNSLTNGSSAITDSSHFEVYTTATGNSATAQSKSAGLASTIFGGDFASHAVIHGTDAGPIAGLAQSSATIDSYDLSIACVTGGALGTAMLTPSLDGGYTKTPTLAVPASGTVVIPGTGIVLACSVGGGNFAAGNVFTGVTVAPGADSDDVLAALNASLIDPNAPGAAVVHIVLLPNSAAEAITQAQQVQTFIDTAKLAGKKWEAVVECPFVGDIINDEGTAALDTADTNTVVRTARVGVTFNGVSVAVGTNNVVSAISGYEIRRMSGTTAVCRIASALCSDSVCSRDLGPLNISHIGRDERLQGVSLFDVQYVTFQTVDSLAGAYFSIEKGGYGWRNMTTDANYQDADSLRALNAALAVVNPVGQRQVGKRFPVNADGTIEEKAAGGLDALFNGSFQRAAGIGKAAAYNGVPQASAVSAAVDRSSNLGPTGDKVLKVNGVWTSLGLASDIEFVAYYGASA